jgi:methylglyoxal synthase
MNDIKSIALVAHDSRKPDLIESVRGNHDVLLKHNLICTGTTGSKIQAALLERIAVDHAVVELKEIILLKFGPLGGDQQLGAMITEGRVDILIFFWDPMEPHPHDVDVKALLRIAVLYNIPVACNRSSADYVISSPLVGQTYEPVLEDYSDILNRAIQ